MGLVKNILYKSSHKSLIKLFKNRSVFPYYHIINDKKVHHIKNLYKYKNVGEFKHDLEILLEHYKPLNPEIIIKNPTKNFKIPQNSFLLSFDDGLKEVYDIIFPVLKEKNIKAIFFINPKFIDNNEILHRHHLSVVVEVLKEIKDTKKLNEISNLFGISYSSHKQLSEYVLKIDSSNKKLLDNVKTELEINIDSYL